ncbi:MAG: NlpC/P60 family protein [Candidatus Spyradocola sp.]|jgi:hypothetical protein
MFARVITGLAPLMTEPARNCEQADEALFGMRVEVLEEKGPWVRVRTHYRYEGWAEKDRLFPEGEGTRDFDAAEKRVLGKRCADLMHEALVESYPLVSVPRGALLGVTGRTSDRGWAEVLLPDGRRAWTRANYLQPHVTSAEGKSEETLRRELVRAALPYLGTPYRWGGKSTLGIDCSGLCSMAYMLCGVLIYRDAKIMPGFPVHSIPFSQVKMGDLLFFPGHVGMYIRDGLFLHSTSHEGDEGVVLASLTPGHPRYREDLRKSMKDCGSIF